MLAIVFTTTEEAAPFVRRHTEGRIEALDEDAPIQTDDLLIAVTGLGKIKATLAAERLLHNHDLKALVHTGTCAALDDELDAGTMMGANFVLEGDRVELDAPTYPRMPLECPYDLPSEGTLVSQDHPSDDADEQSYWERIADARDETAYAVAYVAAQHGTPCHVAKAVSAQAGSDGSSSSAEAADAIASFLRRVMDNQSESAA